MSHGDSTRAAGRLPGQGSFRAIVLVVLLAIGAVGESVYLGSLRNPAVWGHLRAGTWILENRSVPHAGLFSQVANLPWRDFSWGYDAIVATSYKICGLRTVPALAMVFRLAATGVLFLLAGGRRGNVWCEAALACAGLYTLSGVGPTASGATIILFGLELWILSEWRRGVHSLLYFLPLLFLIWANLHIGFICGIVALAMFVVSLFAQQLTRVSLAKEDQRKLARLAAVWVACLLVGGITPYGYSSYMAFWQIETSSANLNIPGYAAMGFRQPLDYIVLLLAMGAFLALGLRRSRDIFHIALLSGSAMLAFHSQRESWLLIVSSVAVIGDVLTAKSAPDAAPQSVRELVAVAACSAAILFWAWAFVIPRDSKLLMARVSETFPVKACDFIRSNSLPHPLFNAYGWGAFLTWYLPEYPVAIDGRRGLYSEETENGYFQLMKVEIPYQSYPAMKTARTILLEKSNVVGNALRNVSGFQVVYEDDLAVVLVQSAKV